jgi:thiol:disulfide interchange protein DsbD
VWVKSLSAGLKRAAAEKKPVLIDFYTEWCGWCRRLDQETYTDPRVRAKARQFVCVKIDAETDSDTASRYRVDGFPTIVFTDAAAKEIHRVTGFAPPEEFLKEMAKALAAKKPS